MDDFFVVILGAIGMFFLWAFLLGFLCIFGAIPVYFLWNWLVPTLFALPSVTFWQAWGLTLLCSFLFKSHGSSSDSKK